MTGGEKIVIVGAGGLVLLALWKAHASAPTILPQKPPPGAAPINPDFSANDYLGSVPVIGQAYKVLKPVAPVVQSGIGKVDNAVGAVNPYGTLKPNGDGTYTDGSGCKITPKPDGTYDRDCGSWDKNIKNPSKTTAIATGGLVYVAKWAGL